MQRIVSFRVYPGDQSGYRTMNQDTYEILKQKWPQFIYHGTHGEFLDVKEADVDSPDCQELIDFLNESGCGISLIWESDNTKQRPLARHVFSKDDLAQAEYLSFRDPVDRMCQAIVDFGKPSKIKNATVKKFKIGWVQGGDMTVAKESFRRKIDAERFAGLTYAEPEYAGRKKLDDPLWVLGAESIIAPMLNRLVYNETYLPVVEDRSRMVLEDIFNPPIFKYRRDDFFEFGAFDVAWTEFLGANQYGYKGRPYFLVSRRFKEFMDREKVKFDWAPIELR